MTFKLQSRKFPIKEGASIDEVADMVRLIMSIPKTLERIVIEDDIRADFWAQDNEPPFGELPEEEVKNLSELMGKVDTSELDVESVDINLEALSVIAGAMLEANRVRRAPSAWVAGSTRAFCKWLGISKSPNRFLGIPLLELSEIPDYKLVLLCSKTYVADPLKSDKALVISMPVEV